MTLTATATGEAIDIRNIRSFYGSVTALVAINPREKPVEFMSFPGPSGSGKSTMPNLIAGFTDLSAGDIRPGTLDRKRREALQLEIRRLHRKPGSPFAYVTRDQEEALVLSDRIAVLNKGRIIPADGKQVIRIRTEAVAIQAPGTGGQRNVITGNRVIPRTPTPSSPFAICSTVELAWNPDDSRLLTDDGSTAEF